jgi:RHS repeat-associated protein
VRQAVDATAAVVAAREWSPYGVEVGDAHAGLGYTGEWFDAGVGLQYLRARWYDSRMGRFLTLDSMMRDLRSPANTHRYNYALANPVRYDDPSGYYFDERADRIVRRHQRDFLNSARRHNPFDNVDLDGDSVTEYSLDDNGFAALIASTMAHEPHMNKQPLFGESGVLFHMLENISATRCVISGHLLKSTCFDAVRDRVLRILEGQELDESDPLVDCAHQFLLNYHPDLDLNEWSNVVATVGMGNMSLSTAAGFWDGRNQYVTGEDLRTTNILGQDISIVSPFNDSSSTLEGYRTLARQLLNRKVNIEYVAANLAEGALRRKNMGLAHTPFHAALWHHQGGIYGLKTLQEAGSGFWGNASAAVEMMYRPLELWGLSSNWDLPAMDPDAYWLPIYQNFIDQTRDGQP